MPAVDLDYGASLGPSARLGMVSTYPPRRCGLAGYAAELGSALSPEFELVVCAVDRHGLTYPDEVAAVIREDDPDDYPRAARILAEHGVNAVLIQHDASVYGGRAGAHLTRLTRELRSRGIPYLLTLHSLRPATDQAWSRAVAQLAADATSVIVFTRAAKSSAVARGLAEADRVRVLPAAVRGVRSRGGYLRPDLAQALAGDASILATVGFLVPSKGLEIGLAAFARIASDRPALRYVIAGATHPDMAGGDGEAYRIRLWELAEKLDLGGRVHFVDAHLTAAERAALLARTDLYLAPAFAIDRTCSGSLTAAVVAGCAVVAGWHPFAAELLAGAGGVVVPGGHVDALAGAMAELLDDRLRFAAARRAASRLGRHLTWPALAARYAAAVRDVVQVRVAPPSAKAAMGEFALPG